MPGALSRASSETFFRSTDSLRPPAAEACELAVLAQPGLLECGDQPASSEQRLDLRTRTAYAAEKPVYRSTYSFGLLARNGHAEEQEVLQLLLARVELVEQLNVWCHNMLSRDM